MDTLDLEPSPAASKPPVGELALAVKLVETAPPPQVQGQIQGQIQGQVQVHAQVQAQTAAQNPAPIPAAAPEAVTPAPAATPLTLPSRTLETPPAQPGAPQKRTSDAPEHHSWAEPAAQISLTPQTPTPRDVPFPITLRSFEATPQSPAIDHVAQPFERPAAPMNEITLRVANPDQTSTSIRMIDRSGELHVAIRASDPQLADSLRGNVEQLTSRLNNNGWSAEVWKPGAVTAAARTQSSSQDMSQGQQGSKFGPGQYLNRDQQNRKQQHPDWVEEFYADNQ